MTRTDSAAAPEADAPRSGQKQYVTFMVGDRTYGVDIVSVREIKQWTPATMLPNQPAYTRGVLNLRGTIVPVHDLRARFGGPLTEATDTHVVVIVWIGQQTIGILVDAVSDIITVSPDDVRPVPAGVGGADEKAISGLVNTEAGLVSLLDLEGLFAANSENAA
ncbi:chemotaxis protein CheW [Oceanicella actignis]|uniref:Purine-binding chemotaxis protein CheW n=1 Tax=Oceanicella actignis TaxID=1189325 RepID=A0A1M7T5R8_9RHOB|nr:chemotaxis protein CheW [Oceanicella actignis]TYO84870.1 purine-binding chemotaxis protein CheW [Oceanicella actignis]SET43340.1 purine-binding chemotaxis protein CheW [Oceanicella actignis]SHN65962.1 purine-binding chemotaxis protein CheW [Oceanicella actignis]